MQSVADRRATGVTPSQAVALTLAAVVLIVARRPDMVLAPQFWAEDAIVFFAQAEAHGASVVFDPFAGSLHLLPRLVAWIAVGVPVIHVPAVYAASALLIAAVAIWLVMRSRLVTSPAVGLAMVTAAAAAPYSHEMWGNIVNTHWFSALPILAASLPPRSRAAGIDLHLALPLFVLSGPSSLVLLPLVATTTRYRTDRWRWLTLSIVCVGAAFTVWAMIGAPRNHDGETLVARFLAVVDAVLHRYPLQVFAATFALLALTAWRAFAVRDLHRLTLAGAACLFAGATCVGAPREALYALPGAGGRYIFIPWIVTSWLIIHALSARRSWRLALAAGVLAGAAVWHYRQPPRPDVQWAQAAACLEAQPSCEVEVTPYSQPVRLPGRGSVQTP